MAVSLQTRPTGSSSMEEDGERVAHMPAEVFLALTQTKLLIACRVLTALITGSGGPSGILRAGLAGEAFKDVAKAVDEAIGGQVDPYWVRIFQGFAEEYRDGDLPNPSKPNKLAPYRT